MKILLAFILLTVSISCFGQKFYKFQYVINLKDQQSTYSIEKNVTQDNNTKIAFLILDNSGDSIPLAEIKIKGNYLDTLLKSDLSGYASISKLVGLYQIQVSALHFSKLSIDTINSTANSNTLIKILLGKINSLKIGHIYSQRKLTSEEIEKITDDLSFHQGQNELLKNKTCYFKLEI